MTATRDRAGSAGRTDVDTVRDPAALTDAELSGPGPLRTTGAVRSRIAGWWRDAVDRLLGSDPGLTQLRTAGLAVLGMAVAVAGAAVLAGTTGALQAPAGSLPAPALTAQHQAVLVVGLLLAALPAMLAGFVVSDPTPLGQLLTSVLLPVPMLAGLAAGVLLEPWHAIDLVYLVVVLMVAVYLRRFGPRGFAGGMVLFNGSFLGYFLGRSLTSGDLGWVAAFVGVGIVASLVVRFSLFRPDNAATLRRMRRSWGARARRLTALLSELMGDDPPPRTVRRIQRQLTRLNESSLMIDAQLVAPGATDAAAVLHQRLFDMESALANTARFAIALRTNFAAYPGMPAVREAVAHVAAEQDDLALADLDALSGLRVEDDRLSVLLDRFGQSVAGYVTARRRWRDAAGLPRRGPRPTVRPDEHDPTDFTPAVGLVSGWLPGSGPVSDRAGSARGRFGRLDAAVLPGHLRASIQIGVAATIAILAGGLISEQRLYWALLATFLAFLATTNSGEQVRKALFRVGGTAVGIVVGALSVHLSGGSTVASLVVIFVALFAGIYLIRVNYTFMAMGITVAMSQLYVRLNEFSWSLLLLRLEETAIGVGAVVLTVLVVLPLRPQRVLSAGVQLYLEALRTVLDRSLDTMVGDGHTSAGDVRALDAALFALTSTARQLRGAVYGRNSSQLTEILSTSTALRNYARTLAAGAHRWPDPPARDALCVAADQLRTSLDAVEARVASGECGTYVRSAALIDRAARLRPDDRSDLVLRDLVLIDGALARLAIALGMPVGDHDTVSPTGTAAVSPTDDPPTDEPPSDPRPVRAGSGRHAAADR